MDIEAHIIYTPALGTSLSHEWEVVWNLSRRKAQEVITYMTLIVTDNPTVRESQYHGGDH
jgi:hypothetical protein